MFFFAREKENFISADNFLRIFNISASIITTSYNLESSDIAAHDTKIDTNPCRDSYWLNDNELNKSFSKGSNQFLRARAVCSNSTSLPIHGMYTEATSSRIRYRLDVCTNSTNLEPGRECYPLNFIEEKLKRLTLHVGAVEGSLDLENIHKPILFSLNSENYVKLKNSTSIVANMMLKKLKVTTDRGLIFQDEEEVDTVAIHSFQVTNYPRDKRGDPICFVDI